jgi:putative peptidoglycan lipid II flippase
VSSSGDGKSGPGSGISTRLGAAALLLAASISLSRVLGYLRDVALANRLGVGSEADAYYAAFQIPDILNHLLAGAAFSIALIPLYARIRDNRGEEEAARLFATVLGTVGLASVAATLALWVFADGLIAFQFPGFDLPTGALAGKLTRIVLPAQIFFVTGGIVRAVLMAEGRFLAQALSPLIYNACIIAGGLLAGRAEGFAWGVLVGAALGPFAVPILDLLRTHRLRLRVAPLDPDFRSYLWLALPLMLGLSLLTVDEWYDKWFGATMAAGTVASLSFARKLMQAPVAVVGQAVATAALPTFARLFASGQREELDRTLLRTLQTTLVLAILAAAAFCLLSGPLVELIYRHGRFSGDAALRVASILSVMALGVPGWVAQQVAVRAFYAREDTWRPMLLGTAVAVAAIPLYWALGSRAGAEGLAAAGALAVSANALATLAWARVRHGAPDLRALFGSVVRTAIIAGAASALALWSMSWIELGGRLGALAELALAGSVFAGVCALGIPLLGDEVIRSTLLGAVRRMRNGRR